jgi:16S rRNA (uracil1498-N3)-methyltransferase
VAGDDAVLGDAEAHYLRSVLRMAPGDRFSAVLPGGPERIATVTHVDEERVRATLGQTVTNDADPHVDVRLYMALTKSGKPELVVQKCTELGISSIHPMLCRRSVSRPKADRAERKSERWQKISEEAARQCGRTSGAWIAPAIPFVDALREIATAGGTGLILTPDGGEAESRALGEATLSPPVSLLIGPEGGFDDGEVECAVASGIARARVGRRVLRAETAAIAVSAIVMRALGEMD